MACDGGKGSAESATLESKRVGNHLVLSLSSTLPSRRVPTFGTRSSRMPAPTAAAAAASAADDKSAINDKDKQASTNTTDSAAQTPKDATIPLPSTSAAAGSSLPANEASAGSVFSSPDMTAAVLAYLQKRGFDRVEAAFKAELDALASGANRRTGSCSG